MSQPPFGIQLSARTLRQIRLTAEQFRRGLAKGKKRSLSQIGAFVRTGARSLIGQRAPYHTAPRSAPRPPKARKGASRDFKRILYFVGPDSVRTGYERFNQQESRQNPSPGSVSVPELHEFGGVARIEEQSYDGRTWVRRNKRRSKRTYMQYRTRVVRYPPRPVMGPALAKELRNPKLMQAWENILGPLGDRRASVFGPGD